MQNLEVEVTAEEAVKLSEQFGTFLLRDIKTMTDKIFESFSDFSSSPLYREMLVITTIWNAGRIQGIRSERKKRNDD